jgi:hypothetical protein
MNTGNNRDGWRVSITCVLCAVGLLLKKQATSAEDPEQEDEDAAGVTSVERLMHKIFFLYLPISNRLAWNLIS